MHVTCIKSLKHCTKSMLDIAATLCTFLKSTIHCQCYYLENAPSPVENVQTDNAIPCISYFWCLRIPHLSFLPVRVSRISRICPVKSLYSQISEIQKFTYILACICMRYSVVYLQCQNVKQVIVAMDIIKSLRSPQLRKKP